MAAPPAQFVRTSDGYDIAYFVAGKGPALVRTPNLWNHTSRQWSREFFAETFDALAERYRLVLYDARGQGLSTRGLPDSHSVDDYVLDLAAVAERVSEPFILMGWSTGCTTAIKFALEHPELVIALVLWEYRTASGGWESFVRLASENWRFYVETSTRVGFPDFDAYRMEEVLFDAMTQSDHTKQLKAFQRVNPDELLKNLSVPTAFVASRNSSRPGAGERAAVKAASNLPGAHLLIFDGREPFKAGSDGTPPEPVAATWSFTQTLLHGHGTTYQSSKLDDLSAREVEVLRLIASGKSNRQIANGLSISIHTVNRHVSNIYTKIQVTNRAGATSYAARSRLI
jgi:pimeloyl-ACP methyl ester carboxylesterase/DNA-binding CsgD family transcriptional regulator